MSLLKELQEYIDKYKSGEISETDFKQRLESDDELKLEFELHQKDLRAIRAGAKVQLRKKATLALEKHEKESINIFSLKRIIQIAAMFIFLVAAFFLIQNLGQPASGADLFSNHFELPAPVGERNDTPQSDTWNRAMTAYANQNFEKTIELLSPLVNDQNFQFSDRGKLFLGVSLLMKNEYQKAINTFDAIPSESSYFKNAEWFKALSFLKMENTSEAKNAFQKIGNQPRHFKQEKAKTILENL
ncbi:MAG: tol-pal system YbgF family protein [Saprospiraceae bacterium]